MAFWQIKSDFREVLSAQDHQYAPIDGLRALAILMVMAFHTLYIAHYLLPKAEFLPFITDLPWGMSMVFTFDKAVDGFFVISGFLLGSSLIKTQQRQEPIQFMAFYRKRFFRLYPLFLLALVLYGAAAWKGDLYTLLANLLFFENNMPEATKLIPVGWSLAIEVQFYLILPWLVLLSGRFLPQVLVGSIFLALVIKAFVVLSNTDFYQIAFIQYLAGHQDPTLLLDSVYYPTWMRFGALMMGVLAAWVWLNRRSWLVDFRLSVWWLGWVLIIAGFMYPDFTKTEVTSPYWNAFGLIVDRYAFALGVSLVMLVSLLPLDQVSRYQRWLTRGLSARFFKSWSEMVYPLYLFHFPMLAIAAVMVFGTTDPKAIASVEPWHLLAIFILGSMLAWLFSLLLHLLIEKPFHRHGRA